MKSALEKIFFKSPVFLQNIAISLYGLTAEYTRYGGNYKNYYKTISSHLKYTQDELNAYVESTLIKTINDAVVNAPYYGELFQRENISSNSIKTIEDLKKVPILEKDELKKAPEYFINRTFNKNKMLIIQTTGTTGTPLKIYCNPETRQKNYAFYSRFLNQVGIAFNRKRATFGGRVILPSDQNRPPFWRYSYFQKNLLFSTYHLREENIPFYIEQLKKYKPDYIDTYPSSLFYIAKFAKSHNIDLIGVTKGITTSSESLFPEQRQVIEDVFGVPIFDQYGSAEMCFFVSQCVENNYHIHTDYGVIEFLREDGTNAKPGEESEIICTSFINPVMPLIRYRIGDRGVYSDKPCKCGSVFPVMEKILGRNDDLIVTPDGRKVCHLGPVVKGLPVKEIQYIQKNKEAVDVLVVKDNQYSADTEKELIKELRMRLGDEISIQFNYVSYIKRGKGGKLKLIISKRDCK